MDVQGVVESVGEEDIVPDEGTGLGSTPGVRGGVGRGRSADGFHSVVSRALALGRIIRPVAERPRTLAVGSRGATTGRSSVYPMVVRGGRGKLKMAGGVRSRGLGVVSAEGDIGGGELGGAGEVLGCVVVGTASGPTFRVEGRITGRGRLVGGSRGIVTGPPQPVLGGLRRTGGDGKDCK
jgi:hypothetical protein